MKYLCTPSAWTLIASPLVAAATYHPSRISTPLHALGWAIVSLSLAMIAVVLLLAVISVVKGGDAHEC